MKIGYFCYWLSGIGPRTRAADVINAVANQSKHNVVVLTHEVDKVTAEADTHEVSIRRPIQLLRTIRNAFSNADVVHVPINLYQVLAVRLVYHGPLVGGVGPGIQTSLPHRYFGRLLRINKKIKTHKYDNRWEKTGYDTEICTATINQKEFWPYDEDRIKELRQDRGIAGDETVILYVGELTEHKGAHIIDEMAKLTESDTSIRFIVAGAGPMEDKFRERENISFEGFIDNKQMPDLYNLADITVAPRKNDNTSNVGLESIACGTPMVTTAEGDIKRLFEDRGAYVWADRNPQSVLDTINDLINDDDRYEEQVQRGLKTIDEMELTIESALETHLRVYEELAGS